MKQFYIKPNSSGEARGPFTREQVAHFAQSGKLQPHHLISLDQKQWTSAERVNGLTFNDTSQDDYGLEPIEPPPPASPERASKSPTAYSGNVPLVKKKRNKATGPSFLSIPNRPLGLALGAIGGLALLSMSCVFFSFISAMTGAHEVLSMLLGLIFGVIAGAALLTAFAMGTDARIWLVPISDHQVECTVRTRIGFLPTRTESTMITPQDQLVLFVRSAADTPHTIDFIFIGAMIALFLFGVCPGIIFLIIYHNQKKEDGTTSRLKLFLYTQARNNIPICLYHRQVGDYYGTKFGTPKEVEQINELFQSQIELLYSVDE